MSFSKYPFFILILGILPVSSALAETDDAQKPITIEADRAELDEKNQISKYLGNVLLQQGSITIKANKLIVFAKEGELQRLSAEGNPVEFLQHRDNKEDIRGSSLRMEYDAESKRFTLMNNAELWQGGNKFSGEQIQFDPENENVIASGSTDDSSKSTQRVQITIQPKPQNK